MTTPNYPAPTVQPYLFFAGRCEEAVEFYKKALGAKVEMLMRFKDNPDGCTPEMVKPGTENNVMHGALRIGNASVLVSDGCGTEAAGFQGFSLALSAADAKEAERLFSAIADGGKVEMPLTSTFFSPSFGVVVDRFGVSWMVVTESAQK